MLSHHRPTNMRTDFRRRVFSAHAFTLVETVIALGIVGFALTAMTGLLPLGLKNFRKAMDLTVQSGMVQELVSHAKRVPFQDLTALQDETFAFDDSGNTVEEISPDCLYVATVLVEDATRLPSSSIYSTSSLAKLTISISRKSSVESAPPEATFVTYVAALSVAHKP